MGCGCSYRDERICNAVATSVFLPLLWKQSLVIKSVRQQIMMPNHLGSLISTEQECILGQPVQSHESRSKNCWSCSSDRTAAPVETWTVNVVSNTDLGVRDHEFPNKKMALLPLDSP